MARLDDGATTKKVLQPQSTFQGIPDWALKYMGNYQPAQSPLTLGTRSMAYGYTPNWMQQYLPTQPVKAAPSPRTREGRMGGTTPRPVQGTATMYGPGQSPGLNERAARTGRGGQVTQPGVNVPSWLQKLFPYQPGQEGRILPTGLTTGYTTTPNLESPTVVQNIAEGEEPGGGLTRALGEAADRMRHWYEGYEPGAENRSPLPMGLTSGYATTPNLEAPFVVREVAEGGEPIGGLAGLLAGTEIPEEPTAPAGVEENTIAEEKLGLRKRTQLHAIQRAYQKRLEDMLNSLDYVQGGEEGYWSAPSGGYWDGYGGGYGGGGYSPEDISSFWLNLARWNI